MKARRARPNERLRRARESRNWTQAELAERIETSTISVSRWELGVQSPLPHFRERLCRLFQMSAGELGLAPDPPSAPGRGWPDGGSEPLPAESSLERRARRDLLAQVHRYWIRTELAAGRDRLAPIDLALVERPAAVDDPVPPVPPSREPDRPLAPGTTIAAAYRAAGEQLLLLGDPGAGKTTLMLGLAEALLAWAEQDPANPAPVVFHLASWAVERPPLADWLVQELHRRYGVAPRLGRAWIETEQVLPLLDGLDEVRREHRRACVSAINAFRRRHGQLSMVVCCRTADYEELDVRLSLRGAVVILPLTPAAVDRYLRENAPALDGLAAMLEEDPLLAALLTTPLLLRILVLTFQDALAAEVRHGGTAEARRERVLADYVDTMLRRAQATTRTYPRDDVLRWLCWLARTMRTHAQATFYPDWIQPGWLPVRSQRRLVTIGTAIGLGAVTGLLATLLVGWVAMATGGLQAAVAAGSTAGLVVALATALGTYGTGIAPTEQLVWSWRTLRPRLPWVVGIGAAGGLVLGLTSGLGAGQEAGPMAALSMALGGGTGATISGGLDAPLYRAPAAPGDGMRTSLRTATVSFLIAAGFVSLGILLASVLVTAVTGATAIAAVLVLAGLGVGLGVGLVPGPSNASRRRSWPRAALGRTLAGGLLTALGAGAIAGGLGGLEFQLGSGGPSPLSAWLAPGVWGFVLGAAAGLTYGLAGGAVVGTVIGVLVAPVLGPRMDVALALTAGLAAGLIAGLQRGGGAYVRHWLLRWLLVRNGQAPPDYLAFLEYASKRILLQPSGGGFQFIHRQLLDHLADREPIGD